jgi:hypothetical protein
VTPTIRANVGRFSATTIAVVLTVAMVIIALVTPEPLGRYSGGMSSYSTAPGGAGIVYELATRLGWHTEQRITTLDSARRAGDTRATVQVVLAPTEPLGAHEIHDLLENVRRGGGLVFSLDGDDALRDSLGLRDRFRSSYLAPVADASCSQPRFGSSSIIALPPQVQEIAWKKRQAFAVDTIESTLLGPTRWLAGAGLHLGKGRVAIIGGADVFSNVALRDCRWAADVVAMKLIDYVRPADSTGGAPVLVFDEFHHGFGVHGGSLKTMAAFLLRTSAGHTLAQLLAAGLLLLFAMAPRPLVPRNDARIARRSPLEHAAALGRAYEDVSATRTAAASLIGGLRRRTRGIVAVPASAGDDDFLDAVSRRLPSLAPEIAVVKHARSQPTTKRELASVGEALATIEEQLLSTPSSRT